MQEQIEISSQEGVAVFLMRRLNAIFLPAASGYEGNFESASTENKEREGSHSHHHHLSSGQSWGTIEILSEWELSLDKHCLQLGGLKLKEGVHLFMADVKIEPRGLKVSLSRFVGLINFPTGHFQ